jgi:hypothetical protein
VKVVCLEEFGYSQPIALGDLLEAFSSLEGDLARATGKGQGTLRSRSIGCWWELLTMGRGADGGHGL